MAVVALIPLKNKYSLIRCAMACKGSGTAFLFWAGKIWQKMRNSGQYLRGEDFEMCFIITM